EDINETIKRYRESLRVGRQDYPERYTKLFNLSSALCSRFANTWKIEDVEEAIEFCQEALAVLPPLHPDRHYSHFRIRKAYMSRYRVQHKPADL
ncbi:uncharacterized protein EDB91DRAFT_1007962, partial [Suillus paluster]|uniref:uncharacterized protein n=1 Tax=Suillus paluster TaxID=48578 RepID=UPI001B85D85A